MSSQSATRKVTVLNPAGLHARPSLAMVQAVRRSRSKVQVRTPRQTVDAGDILEILGLGGDVRWVRKAEEVLSHWPTCSPIASASAASQVRIAAHRGSGPNRSPASASSPASVRIDAEQRGGPLTALDAAMRRRHRRLDVPANGASSGSISAPAGWGGSSRVGAAVELPPQPDGATTGRGFMGLRRRMPNAVATSKPLALAENGRPIDHRPQFADVSRPRVRHQQRQVFRRWRTGANPNRVAARSAKCAASRAMSSRRSRNGGSTIGKHGDPIPEILAETVLRPPSRPGRGAWRR